jgi:hypothetical protein
MSQPGGLGESLVRNGLNQSSFALFVAKVAERHIKAGRSADQLADVFALLSACNASAARQALGDCSLTFEGEKLQSVSAYWAKLGGGKAAPNLAMLDL